MDAIKRIVLFVVVLVLGLVVVSALIPPAVDDALADPAVGNFTGLDAFLRLTPFLVLVGVVVGALMMLFARARRRVDHSVGATPVLPTGYIRRVRLPWRR